MDPFFAAWAAGFFDGEGSVYISKQYQMQIAISQSDRSPLEDIQRLYGGKIVLIARRGERAIGQYTNSRDCWRIYFPNLEARAFLIDILPYLRLKKPHVEVALAYITTTLALISLRSGQGRKRGLTGIERAARRSFYERLKMLNTNPPIIEKTIQEPPHPHQVSLFET